MKEGKLSRRRFLLAGGGAAGMLVVPAVVQAVPLRKKVARLAELKVGEPRTFTYPGDEPAYLLDMGRAVAGGVGPKRSLVAFSALCQHMGCPLQYEAVSGHLVCPCHASRFDPKRNGDCIEGPATRGLPRIALRVVGEEVYAVGVENGLVYGRACNHA